MRPGAEMADQFQDRLRELIERAGSQSELSRRSGVTQPILSSWLSGSYRPSLRFAAKLATAMNVEVGWLLGESSPALDIKLLAMAIETLEERIDELEIRGEIKLDTRARMIADEYGLLAREEQVPTRRRARQIAREIVRRAA